MPELTPYLQDIHEIVRASDSSSWKIREEGVHKLKVRINEERGFNVRERKIVLQLFEQLLNDNHAKILGSVSSHNHSFSTQPNYGTVPISLTFLPLLQITPSSANNSLPLQTLDVLDEFLALYRSNLTDWGCNILSKALYLQSMKQTASNFERVMRLLDTLHRSFPYDLQLTWCFSILESRQVTGNAKMKVGVQHGSQLSAQLYSTIVHSICSTL